MSATVEKLRLREVCYQIFDDPVTAASETASARSAKRRVLT
jgi:hypothetical protein